MAKYILSASLLLSLTLSVQSWTVQPRLQTTASRRSMSTLASSNEATSATPMAETGDEKTHETVTLTQDLISKLRFRELQSELSHRDLPIEGTTGQLRDRLREAVGLETECIINEDGMGDDCIDESMVGTLSTAIVLLQILAGV